MIDTNILIFILIGVDAILLMMYLSLFRMYKRLNQVSSMTALALLIVSERLDAEIAEKDTKEG